MASGLIGSDSYTEQFTWGEPVDAEGDPKAVAERIAAALEAETGEIDWRKVVGKERPSTDS
jgi:hypothetical protein